MNAATFFIPKKPKGYQPLKYAYINFYSQEDLETATSNIYQYKGNQLEWAPADEKSCNICGYTNHMAIECDYQLKQNKNNNRYLNRKNKLKEIKGYNINRNRNRTYADVTKSINRNNQFKGRSNSLQFRSWNQTNILHDTMGNWDEDFDDEFINNKSNNKLHNGTKSGSSMHDRNNNVINNLKNQIQELTKLVGKVVLESKSMKEELVKLKAEQIQKDNNQKENRNNKKGVHFNISSSSKLNDNNKRLKTDSSDSEKEKEENINIFENKLKQQDKYLNNIAESLLNIQSQLEKIEHNKKDDVSVGGSYNIHDNDDELIDIN